jgi:hypothetical protein
MGREKQGDFHPTINEWRGNEWGPGQMRVVPGPGMGNLKTHTILSRPYFYDV